MHLIDTTTLQLVDAVEDGSCGYAILSHRWGDDEVLFHDMKDVASCQKEGVAKLKGFCNLGRQMQYQFVWMDSCCIDKTSSAELSEAINSMYRYYANSAICVAYLSDVHVTSTDPSFEELFCSSVWFTRSWTLQELLAPRDLVFYNSRWERLGAKTDLVGNICKATLIDSGALQGAELHNYSIAERMAWASRRQATRPEDMAYSLIGIFDVNMPMLYGEGKRAFSRLQEEIVRYSDDETIFAWSSENAPSITSGLLASSPTDFQSCRNVKPSRLHDRADAFMLTSRGLTGSLNMVRQQSSYNGCAVYLAFLNASLRVVGESERFIGIYLQQFGLDEQNFKRVSYHGSDRWFGSHPQVSSLQDSVKQLYVRHRGDKLEFQPDIAYGFDLGKSIRNLATSWMSVFSANMSVDGTQVHLAPGSNWASVDNVDKFVFRLPPKLIGPVCNIVVQPSYHGIALVQLGLWHGERPYCVLIDESVMKTCVSNKSPSKSLDGIVNIESFGRVDFDDIGWTKFITHLRDDHISYTMLFNQPHTGVIAFCGLKDEATRWICLQPDLMNGQFKRRSNVIVKMAPYTRSHQHLWQFELEHSSKMVLYTESSTS